MHRDITVSSSERRSKAYNAFLMQFSHVISLPSHFYTTIFNLLNIDFFVTRVKKQNTVCYLSGRKYKGISSNQASVTRLRIHNDSVKYFEFIRYIPPFIFHTFIFPSQTINIAGVEIVASTQTLANNGFARRSCRFAFTDRIIR